MIEYTKDATFDQSSSFQISNIIHFIVQNKNKQKKINQILY